MWGLLRRSKGGKRNFERLSSRGHHGKGVVKEPAGGLIVDILPEMPGFSLRVSGTVTGQIVVGSNTTITT